MITAHPYRLIGVGFVLVLVGFLLALGMVAFQVPASFLLCLIAFIASTAGLIMGMTSAALVIRERRRNW